MLPDSSAPATIRLKAWVVFMVVRLSCVIRRCRAGRRRSKYTRAGSLLMGTVANFCGTRQRHAGKPPPGQAVRRSSCARRFDAQSVMGNPGLVSHADNIRATRGSTASP
jgi:hypothetical protein